MKKKSLKIFEHYVKISIGRRREWLKVSMPLIPQKPDNYRFLVGESVSTGKKLNFHPSDVVAFFSGKLSDVTGLGMPYIPTADVCNILDTVVPDSMGYETHIAARIIELKIGRPLNEFVADKLQYTELELCKSLSAEQVDAVALAIYNIEERKQGMIIGDQTGIGKGRVAAAMIRYGHFNKIRPIFLSEKPNLFSDIYRDLVDIGSGNLVPFIVNTKEAKTDIKDNDGNIVYTALPKIDQERIFNAQKFPQGYDYVCSTYTQFSSGDKKPTKPNFLRAISKGNLIIMDEAHNASGSSNTGEFLQEVIVECRGCVFLSATFAKRPDNMPIYALKTCISEANMSRDELVEAITKGGVALQEVLASQLVAEGQMIRRERSFEGVEVNYITLTEKEQEHKATFDNITDVLRDIIFFQETFVTKIVEQMDKIAAAEGKEIKERKGTNKAGVDNTPYFSKVFQVINQILFSLKAPSVAEMAIERLEQGKAPIIAFSSTMETFLDELGEVGDTIDLDFRTVLIKGLDGVLRYTVTDINGQREQKFMTPDELGLEASTAYFEIIAKINKISTGISVSPIDIIKDTIRKAGYSCDEVTGRNLEVQMIDGHPNTGVLLRRKKILANDAFRQFNNNELDCLLINQSGSTGASAHAIVTKKVSKEQVKQRVMLVLQTELDINREVQKRGRTNRTGQILKPIYDYVSSCIPAERRLTMMLRKKLKSLDANTTSNQKQSDNILQSDDFLNKYGDRVVTEYLKENPVINELLGDPLFLNKEESKAIMENAASKVSGRVAVLSTTDQEKFYDEILDRYNDLVSYLRQSGQYDLEVEDMNLEAETLDKVTVIEGKAGTSVFSENTFMETCEVNVLKKPFTRAEIKNLIENSLKGEEPLEQQQRILDEVKAYYTARLAKDIEDINKKFDRLILEIEKEPKYLTLLSAPERAEYRANRARTIEKARPEAIALENTKSSGKLENILRILKFYFCGRALKFPTFFNATVPAVCVGINIDGKKPNPYAPSAIKIKIAIANSEKYIDLSLSGDPGKTLNEIIGYSYSISKNDHERIVEEWEQLTKNANVSRRKAIIITGNILQAYSKYDSGKLISFTTKDGSIRKGILLPENFDPVKNGKAGFVTITISKAEKYILNMPEDSSVSTPDGKIIINHYAGHSGNDYYLMVPANKNYKQLFEDKKIMKLCNNIRDGFEKRSDKMVAYFMTSNIPALLEQLDKTHGLSVLLSNSVYEKYVTKKEPLKVKSNLIDQAEKVYETDKENFEVRKRMQVISDDRKTESSSISLLKLKMKMKAKSMELSNK